MVQYHEMLRGCCRRRYYQMEQEAVVSLVQAMTLLQGVVLSCIDHRRFPFTKTQLGVFTVLAMEGELTMKRIAQYIASSQEQATRAVAPLADAGYVERRTDPANRTRVYVHLSEQGQALIQETSSMIREKLSCKLDDSLSEEERAELFQAVSAVVKLMEKVK